MFTRFGSPRGIAIGAAAAAVSFGVLPAARAQVPFPPNCTVTLAGQVVPCHYRFYSDGSWDKMRVNVQLQDAAGLPVPACMVQVTLVPNPGTRAFCTCCPNPVVVVTDPLGNASALFRQIGGHGSISVRVDALCGGVTPIATLPANFTSPDLNGSCQPVPVPATDVFDLGVWAGCLPPAPYCIWSDYNCDGMVDVFDLGLLAGGLSLSCGMAPCP